MNLIKAFLEFFQGAFNFRMKAYSILEKELRVMEDEFILLIRSDLLGVGLPTDYYTLDILPYLAKEEENWIRRTIRRKSVWEEKFSHLDMDP